jgi:hypothetical protein
MKNLLKFQEFLNESIFDQNRDSLSTFGSIISGKSSFTGGSTINSNKEIPKNNSSQPKTPQRNPFTPPGKSIVIGDSLSPNIAKCSQADLIDKNAGPSSLWKGGIAIKTLLDYVKSYGKSDSTVKNVVISIGTNGIFARSTDTVNKLVEELKKKFPNAKLLVVKGTYGPKATWSSALTKVSQTTVDNYYSDFSNKGVFVVPTAIGNQKDAHNYTDIYTTIGKEIDDNLI